MKRKTEDSPGRAYIRTLVGGMLAEWANIYCPEMDVIGAVERILVKYDKEFNDPEWEITLNPLFDFEKDDPFERGRQTAIHTHEVIRDDVKGHPSGEAKYIEDEVHRVVSRLLISCALCYKVDRYRIPSPLEPLCFYWAKEPVN